MKRIVIILSLLILYNTTWAQKTDRPQLPREMIIEDFVDNLSIRQKKQLNAVRLASKSKLENLKNELNIVRDSIRINMDMYGDNSMVLFPLFEREANIQKEISKETYRVKVRIDNILTREQYNVLTKKIRASHKKNKPGPRGEHHGNRGDNPPRP